MSDLLQRSVLCAALIIAGSVGNFLRDVTSATEQKPEETTVANSWDAESSDDVLQDDVSQESAPLDIAPHKFVASVDSPLLCDICKEPEYHKNHKVSEEQVSVDTVTNVDCKCDICKCVDCKCGSEDLQPQAAAPAGRWVLVNVPVYGFLGRQRGSQQVWQWQGPQQAHANYWRAYSSCANGQCGR